MNKHINYFLFGQNKADKKKKSCLSIDKKIKDFLPLKNLPPIGQIGDKFVNMIDLAEEKPNNYIDNINETNNENNDDLKNNENEDQEKNEKEEKKKKMSKKKTKR